MINSPTSVTMAPSNATIGSHAVLAFCHYVFWKASSRENADHFMTKLIEGDGLKKGDPILVDSDESPRPDASIEALRALKPAFKKDGTVTAGNAPGVNDGAAALVVTSAERAAAQAIAHLETV